jgi:hypothetical protein
MTSIAPLVAEYAVNIGLAKRLSPELRVTMRPLSRSRGSALWIRKKTPLTLVSKRESKSASVVWENGFEMRTPAFATSTSMGVDPLEKRADPFQVAHVALDERALATLLLNLAQDLFPVLLGPHIVHYDEKAVPREALGGGGSEAAARTCYQRNPRGLALRISHDV